MGVTYTEQIYMKKLQNKSLLKVISVFRYIIITRYLLYFPCIGLFLDYKEFKMIFVTFYLSS